MIKSLYFMNIMNYTFLVIFCCMFAILFLFFPITYFLAGSVIISLAIFVVLKPKIGLYILVFILSWRGLLVGQGFLLGSYMSDAGGVINIFITIMGLLYIVINKKNIFTYKLAAVYSVFLLISLMSCFFSRDILLSFRFFFRMLTPFWVSIICFHEITTLNDAKRISNLILLAAVVPIVWGIVESFLNLQSQYRISSIFGHPNPFSFYLLLILAIIFTRTITEKSYFRKIFDLIVVIIVICLIILTYCRISWIALFINLTVIPLMFKKKSYIFLGLLSCIILVSFNILHVSERLVELTGFIQKGDFFDTANSIGWRFKAWDLTIDEFIKRPLFGYGLRSHFNLLHSLYGIKTSIHNSYLEILYDMGCIGFFFFAVFLATLIKACVTWIKRQRINALSQEHMSYMAICCVVVLSYLIIMISDNILEYYDIGALYWIIFAVGFKFIYLQDRHQI